MFGLVELYLSLFLYGFAWCTFVKGWT